MAELRRQYPLGELIGGIHDSEQRFVADVRVESQTKVKRKKNSKNYTVSVSIEVSCQFALEASSIEEAKAKALQLAQSSIDISFDSICQSPEVDYLPIADDAVEE